MLKELFSNRLFIGALAFFILCVAGSLFYMHHENQKGAEYDAETQDRVAQWNAKQNQQPPAEAPVKATPQGGHFHEDGTFHAESHAARMDSPPTIETTTLVPVAENNAAPKAPDMSFLDNPEEAIRRHAEILLDSDSDLMEKDRVFWEHITLSNKLRIGYYGKGEHKDALQKLQWELVDAPLLRMKGVDPERLRASVPRKHDPNYVPAPPISLRFGPDTIKRAREALKEGGNTE